MSAPAPRRPAPRQVIEAEVQPLPQAPAPVRHHHPLLEARPQTFLKGMVVLTLLVLFEVAAIPRLAPEMRLVPPWELLTPVGGLTFYAVAFFGGLLVLNILPMHYLVRCVLLAGTGIAMMVVALAHMRLEVRAFAFRGHPWMDAIFNGSSGALAMILTSLILPTALYWRSRYTGSFWSRIAVLIGIFVVLIPYVLINAVLVGDGPPTVVALAESIGDGLVADRFSALILLVPAALIPLSLLALLPHPRSGFAGLWAWLYVTALAAAPIMQAVHVSRYSADQWKHVLAPLKVSLFLYAALLVAPLALGHLIGEIERQLVIRRTRRT